MKSEATGRYCIFGKDIARARDVMSLSVPTCVIGDPKMREALGFGESKPDNDKDLGLNSNTLVAGIGCST